MRLRSDWLRLALLAAALAACDGSAPAPLGPRWIELAREFRSSSVDEVAQRLEAAARRAQPAQVVRDASGEAWLEVALPRADWRAGERACEWRTKLPGGGAMLLVDTKRMVLADGAGREWTQIPPKQLGAKRAAKRFIVVDGEIAVCLEGEGGPTESMRFRARLVNGREVDGKWRAHEGDLTASGILVFPGAPERLRCEIPPGSRLCLSTVAPAANGGEAAPTTFRVRLGGRTLLEHREVAEGPLRGAWHSLELDVSGRQELEFEVEGPAPALFATPVIAPRELGRPGARPWKDERPDIVLFLCDTFRADNLAAWGGAAEHAPHLNALVERSLRFLDARAAASWTLPSIGTLLTGVYPAQHGGTDLDRTVRSEADTLAEVLGRAGYRTAALTDAVLFSSHYGQDQGFEWFEETPPDDWSLDATLARARARLACDDGRPLFLVVHTYRVHAPMRWGPEEDKEPWNEAQREREGRHRERLEKGLGDEEDPEFQALGRRFYLNAVSDLDAKAGPWLDELERDGFFERGVFVLTADHGNAYGENGQFGHGGELFDVKLRVPLALRGRGVEARDVRGVVSLVDLAPTLAELAHVAPSPTWAGRSLLGALAERPTFAFELRKRFSQIALFAEQRKLMAPDVEALRAGKPAHAFDLEQDPREEHDLAGGAPWAKDLGRSLAEELERLVVPVGGPSIDGQDVDLPPDVQEQLDATGYGGKGG